MTIKKFLSIIFLFSIVLGAPSIKTIGAQQINDEILVKLKISGNENTIAQSVDGEILKYLTKNLILIRLKNNNIENAEKSLSNRSDVEYYSKNEQLKQSVNTKMATHIELWNMSAKKNSSVAAILQNINLRLPKNKIAFIDTEDRSIELNSDPKEIVKYDFTQKTQTSSDEAIFYYASINDRQTTESLIKSLIWAKENKISLIGLNIYPMDDSPVLEHVIKDIWNSGIQIVHFRNANNKEDQAFTQRLKDYILDFEFIEKKPTPQVTAIAPLVIPVPTIDSKREATFELPSIQPDDLKMKLVQSENGRNLIITVNTKEKSQKNYLQDVDVTVDLTTPDGKIFTGNDLTDANGKCEFILRNIEQSGHYSAKIINLKKQGYTSSTVSDTISSIEVE